MRHIGNTAVLLLALVSSSFAYQQTPPADEKSGDVLDSQTVIRSATRLVIVDVVAKNSKGEPVTDLKNEDFAVLENGKPQPVKVFNFQSRAVNSVRSISTVPTIAPDVVTNIPPYKTTGALNIILLDGLNTSVPRQTYMREQMVALLEQLPEGEPIAVYTLGQKLQLIQDFTDDHGTLKKVIQGMRNNISVVAENPLGNPARATIPGSFLQALPAAMRSKMEEFEKESEVAGADYKVSLTLSAMDSIARYVAGFPGRKNLIWVSDALPLYVNATTALKPVRYQDARDYGHAISRTANNLMDLQVVIYPVDAHGLMVPPFQDIGIGDPRDAVGGRPPEANYGSASLVLMAHAFEERTDIHTAMNQLADSTGGQALYNSNDLDVLVRGAIDDGATYYTLGYYPADKNWDGKFRKIQVRVARPGVKLRYRLGYFAVSPTIYMQEDAKQHQTAVAQALNLNSPVSTGLPFRAKILTPSETPHKVVVNFAIEPHAITFERNPAGLQTASLDCMVEVYASENKSLQTQSTAVHAELTQENFDKINRSFFPCQQTVELPAGSYILRLGVIDNRTGLIGTANGTVKVN